MIEMKNYMFSSESVSDGHPDKVADQISDLVLDLHLEKDSNAKVACETLITKDTIVLAGEIKSHFQLDYTEAKKAIVNLLRKIGYDCETKGFDAFNFELIYKIQSQSPEINKGVSDGGAGDQGIMFGYACNETPELMPLPIMLSHKIMLRHKQLRESGNYQFLYPDAKSQVTIAYEGGKPARILNVVCSSQHSSDISLNDLRELILEEVVLPELHEAGIPFDGAEFAINPAGTFTFGGPAVDTGLTGRKIIVDTYGGSAPHGGGAFSGKDPSKVDRSAAYMARYIAKNFIHAGFADKCTVQLGYAIGEANPKSVYINFHGTEQHSRCEADALQLAAEIFDTKPNAIIERLNLKRPIYSETTCFGHFGKKNLPWEETGVLQTYRPIKI